MLLDVQIDCRVAGDGENKSHWEPTSPTRPDIANPLELLSTSFVLDRRSIGCPLKPSPISLPAESVSGLIFRRNCR